jgi:hypothetical protein
MFIDILTIIKTLIRCLAEERDKASGGLWSALRFVPRNYRMSFVCELQGRQSGRYSSTFVLQCISNGGGQGVRVLRRVRHLILCWSVYCTLCSIEVSSWGRISMRRETYRRKRAMRQYLQERRTLPNTSAINSKNSGHSSSRQGLVVYRTAEDDLT